MAAYLQELVPIGALAVKIGDDDGFGKLVVLLGFDQFGPQQFGVHVPRGPVRIEEGQGGPQKGHRTDTADEGKRGGQDGVARADSEFPQRQMHRGGAAVECETVRNTGVGGEFLFKRLHHRTQGRDVITLEGFVNQLQFLRTQMWRGEEDGGGGHKIRN